MKKGIVALIMFDVVNEYFDILNSRLKRAIDNGQRCIYIGDFLTYTTTLFINNGWSEETDSFNDIKIILHNAISLCLSANDIASYEFSDEANYIKW